MTLGRLGALYDTSAWFDKALHLGNSVLAGILGFRAVYVLRFTGKFSARKLVTGIMIVLLTLGVGSLWEILEYLADVFFAKGALGSPLLAPLDDTMMEQPLRLHGMWMQLVNGHGAHNPLKHTIGLKPEGKLSVDITADAPGVWAFHCQILTYSQSRTAVCNLMRTAQTLD